MRGSFYKPELDGLRFFAFLAVFWSHVVTRSPALWAKFGAAGPWLALTVRSGTWGLDLFFVLSSYLITELLLRELDERKTLAIKSFWIRRALRIWPLYFAYLLFAVVAAPHLMQEHMAGRFAAAYATFTANWAIVAWGAGETIMGALWSISIEEQFYFLWPLAIRALSPRRLLTMTVALIPLAFIARVLLIPRVGNAFDMSIWCNTIARLDPIACGALLALLLRRWRPSLSWASAGAILAASVVTILLTMRFESAVMARPLLGSAVYLVNALACTAMVFASTSAPEGGWLTRRWLVYLGRISYGLYVFHALGTIIAWELRARYGAPGSVVANGLVPLVAFGATLLMAAVSYRWLEVPFLRLKERFSVVRSAPLMATKE